MSGKTKRLLSLVLALVLLLALLPGGALAEDVFLSGECGDDLSWVLYHGGLLTISGTGAMYDYPRNAEYASWYGNQMIITEIVIAEGVTGIGNRAFYGCTALQRITIPASVTSIGDNAFFNCDSLTEITVPATVTRLGDGPFASCRRLTDIKAEEANPAFTAVEGVLFDKSGTALIQFPGGRSGAYSIPEGVTDIRPEAFRGCFSLTGVTIPDGVTTIGCSAFYDCRALKGASIPDSVTTVEDKAFFSCGAMTELTIGNSVTTIGEFAFGDCRSLTFVAVPDSVTSIGVAAFSGCSALTGAVLGSGLKNIVEAPFAGCGAMTHITVAASNPYFRDIDGVLFNKSGTTLIQFPRGRSGAYAIPDGVTDFGPAAFSGCKALTGVTIPDSVTAIGERVFSGCKALTDMTIPNSVTSIGSDAFSGCSALAEVNIPDSVTRLGSHAFAECSSLTRVTVPGSITRIGNYAFSHCTGLIDVVLRDNIREIGEGAFIGCSDLTSIIIPNSVTSVGARAFQNCLSLADVYFVGTTQEWFSISMASGNECLRRTELLCLTPLRITKQPANCAAPEGGRAYFSLKAQGEDLSYQWYVKNPGAEEFSKSKVTSPSYSTVLTEAKNGRQIYCIVTDAMGNTVQSDTVTMTIEAPAFGTPALKSAAAGTNGVTVSWGEVSGAVRYRVYRRNGSGGWVGLGDVTGTGYTDTDVAPGAAYTYTVKAWNGTEWSGFDPAGITVTVRDVFTAPVLTGAAAGTDGVTVSWSEVSGAVSYRVYRKTDSGWLGLGDVTGTSFTDAAVASGVTYTYTVKAYNGSAWSGFDAKGVSATAKDAFGAPVLKSAAAGTNGITVTWNAVSGAKSYRVYRKTDSGWIGLGDVTETSFTDADVVSGTTYTYTVKAYNGSAWSGFDAKGVSATAKDAFGAPVLKSAAAGTNGITVTWNAVSGAKSYRVYRKTDSGWIGLGDVTETSFTDADVVSGVAYTYTVKAWNGAAWSGFDAGGVSAAAE